MLAWRKRSSGQQDIPTYEDQLDHEYASDYYNSYDQEGYYGPEGVQPQMRQYPQVALHVCMYVYVYVYIY